MSVGIIELHYKQVLPESVMIQICFTCLPQTSWHLHSLATLGKERRENLSHSQEGVLWIHFLGQEDKRELFCWVYQWFNPDTAYFWQNTRLTVLCNFLEALCLRRADTVICASSCPSPATHTQHHSWALRGALCLIVGLMHTLMAYWYWFQHGEYLFHRAHPPFLGSGKKLTLVLACSKEAPSSYLHELQEWEADQKATELWRAVTLGIRFQLGNKKASGLQGSWWSCYMSHSLLFPILELVNNNLFWSYRFNSTSIYWVLTMFQE